MRSGIPDEALQVIRDTIEPQIADADKKKPWIWIKHMRLHYSGSTATSLMADHFKFWTTNQTGHETVQDREKRIPQISSLCDYGSNLYLGYGIVILEMSY